MLTHRLVILRYLRIRILLILVLLVSSCRLPNPFFIELGQPTHVETIVAKQEDVREWMLSPRGDKIVYWSNNPSGLFLLVPATQQKYELDIFCNYFGWLDDTLLWCTTDSGQSSIVDTNDFIIVPLKQVDGQEFDLALEKLLKTGIIYRDKETNQAFFVLNTDYKNNLNENYYITVPDANAVLQGYDYIPVPNQKAITPGEKIYSSNEKFYYSLASEDTQNPDPDHFLTIYNAATNEKLSDFSISDPILIDIGGWAADSSGVYFTVLPGRMLNDPRMAINKLNVPNE